MVIIGLIRKNPAPSGTFCVIDLRGENMIYNTGDDIGWAIIKKNEISEDRMRSFIEEMSDLHFSGAHCIAKYITNYEKSRQYEPNPNLSAASYLEIACCVKEYSQNIFEKVASQITEILLKNGFLQAFKFDQTNDLLLRPTEPYNTPTDLISVGLRVLQPKKPSSLLDTTIERIKNIFGYAERDRQEL